MSFFSTIKRERKKERDISVYHLECLKEQQIVTVNLRGEKEFALSQI